MQPKLQPNKVRLSIQIPSELKSKLSKLSVFQGKKVSVLVRESIEEKLEEIEKVILEEKMKQAYQALAQENLKISEDFKYVDSENL
jgi:predicted DNA-binding protein